MARRRGAWAAGRGSRHGARAARRPGRAARPVGCALGAISPVFWPGLTQYCS